MNRSIFNKLISSKVQLTELGAIVHLGAGRCSELECYSTVSADKVILVEADPQQLKFLENHTSKHSNTHIINKAIISDDNNTSSDWVDFYLTKPRQFSGLVKPEHFKKIFKNIIVETVEQVSAITLEALVKEFQLSAEKVNVLVVQLNGSEYELLKNTPEHVLRLFSVVVVQQAKHLRDQQETENAALLGSHLSLKFEEPHDLVFSNQVYIRDDKQLRIEKLEAENLYLKSQFEQSQETIRKQALEAMESSQSLIDDNTKLKSSNTELESALSVLQSERLLNEQQISKLGDENETSQRLVEELQVQMQELSERAAKLDESNKAIALNKGALEEEIKVITQTNEQLRQDNSELQDIKKALEDITSESEVLKSDYANTLRNKDAVLLEKQTLIDKLEQELTEKDVKLAKLLEQSISGNAIEQIVAKITENQKSELAEFKRNLDKRIDKGFNNSIKQVESFIGVQSFLETGELGMDFHGWPISSDIALYLLGRIKANNYDLIIEFGSGTSTQLFAKAMRQLTSSSLELIPSKKERLLAGDLHQGKNSELVEFTQDLPARVLTFEHNKKYFDKTLSELEQNGLADMVNLVHAPLIDCPIGEDNYLYYDCDKSLSHIADIYQGRTAKILVLVDGPPGATGPFARMPAMRKLLNNLANHQLDVVLDDYIRNEEKQIVKEWRDNLQARFIHFEEEHVPCEKEAFVFHINP